MNLILTFSLASLASTEAAERRPTTVRSGTLESGLPNAPRSYAKMIPLSIGAILIRCEEDSLSPEQALGRFQWLRRHHPGLLLAYYNQTLGDDGTSGESKITDIEREWFFIAGDRTRPKSRPNYLTFGDSTYANPLRWYAPMLESTEFQNFPDGYQALGICTSSCYTPEQRLLFGSGSTAIQEAFEENFQDIFSLNDDATLENFHLENRRVKSYTRSATVTTHRILTLMTAGGGRLRVTPNHPLLRGDGVMVEAADLEVGDPLIRVEGQDDPIIAIEEQSYFGRVYNVQTDASTPAGQIVAAEGFLSGSSWFQNDGNEYLNRLILRRRVPAAVFE